MVYESEETTEWSWLQHDHDDHDDDVDDGIDIILTWRNRLGSWSQKYTENLFGFPSLELVMHTGSEVSGKEFQ